MILLRVENPNPNVREYAKSFLTSNVDVGDTSVPVASVSGFNDDNFVQIGNTADELTEIVLNSDVSGSPITVAALIHAHPASTPVYEVYYDKIKFYRLRGSTESEVATVPLQIGAQFTVFSDNDSEDGDMYASAFYNSNSGDETPKTDYMEIVGFLYNSKRGLTIRAQELYDDLNEMSVSSKMWENWLNEGINDLQKAAERKDQSFGLKTVELTTPIDYGANIGTGFELPSDFRSSKSVWVDYGGGYREAYPEDVDLASPTSQYADRSPSWSFRGNVIVVRPYAATQMRLMYYPKSTRLVADSDVPPDPMSYYDDALVDYMLLRAYQRKNDKDMIPVFFASLRDKKNSMLQEISQRNKGRRQAIGRSYMWMDTRDSNRAI